MNNTQITILVRKLLSINLELNDALNERDITKKNIMIAKANDELANVSLVLLEHRDSKEKSK